MIFSPCITLNRHGHVSWRPPPCFLPGASRPLRTCRQRLASRHIFRHSSFTRIPGRCRSHDSVGCFPVFFVFFCCCGGCDTMTIYIISWILMRVGTICVCVGVLTCFGLGISQSQWRGRAAGSTTPDSTISRTWSCNLKPSTAFQCCTGTSKLAARWRSVLQHSRS